VLFSLLEPAAPTMLMLFDRREPDRRPPHRRRPPHKREPIDPAPMRSRRPQRAGAAVPSDGALDRANERQLRQHGGSHRHWLHPQESMTLCCLFIQRRIETASAGFDSRRFGTFRRQRDCNRKTRARARARSQLSERQRASCAIRSGARQNTSHCRRPPPGAMLRCSYTVAV
jgi:hypothetical protein